MTHNDLKAISRDWTIGRKLKYLELKLREWRSALMLAESYHEVNEVRNQMAEALDICRSVPVPPTSIKDGSS